MVKNPNTLNPRQPLNWRSLGLLGTLLITASCANRQTQPIETSMPLPISTFTNISEPFIIPIPSTTPDLSIYTTSANDVKGTATARSPEEQSNLREKLGTKYLKGLIRFTTYFKGQGRPFNNGSGILIEKLSGSNINCLIGSSAQHVLEYNASLAANTTGLSVINENSNMRPFDLMFAKDQNIVNIGSFRNGNKVDGFSLFALCFDKQFDLSGLEGVGVDSFDPNFDFNKLSTPVISAGYPQAINTDDTNTNIFISEGETLGHYYGVFPWVSTLTANYSSGGITIDVKTKKIIGLTFGLADRGTATLADVPANFLTAYDTFRQEMIFKYGVK